jgi:UDP-N-acetyl-D-glucosamine dehydrogenase
VDPGRTDYTLRTTPKVVGGLTEACADRAEALYGEVCDTVVRVSTPEAAELTKLLENLSLGEHRAGQRAGDATDRMGIDIWEVVDAAATKPYGFMRFDPGPGMGGHCLPVDPFYLSWRAREFDMATEFIELAGPYHCVAKVERALNAAGLAVNGSKVALFGVSYKRNVGDVRESPALKMITLLGALGARVAYHDPFVGQLPAFGLEHQSFESVLQDADIAVVVTAHDGVDHARSSPARRARSTCAASRAGHPSRPSSASSLSSLRVGRRADLDTQRAGTPRVAQPCFGLLRELPGDRALRLEAQLAHRPVPRGQRAQEWAGRVGRVRVGPDLLLADDQDRFGQGDRLVGAIPDLHLHRQSRTLAGLS